MPLGTCFSHVKVNSLLVLRLGGWLGGLVGGWVWTLKLMLSQPNLKLELELGLSLAIFEYIRIFAMLCVELDQHNDIIGIYLYLAKG